jgi:hypothetical protein
MSDECLVKYVLSLDVNRKKIYIPIVAIFFELNLCSTTAV